MSARAPGGCADVCAAVAAVGADLVISVQCARIIREPLIRVPRRGVVNVHNSPLPLLRGCDPFAWAIHDGLRMHGVSLHDVPDAGVDNGAVYDQVRLRCSRVCVFVFVCVCGGGGVRVCVCHMFCPRAIITRCCGRSSRTRPRGTCTAGASRRR